MNNFENLLTDDFNQRDALLDREEQIELNNLRKKQANNQKFSKEERDRFLILQEKENAVRKGEDLTEEEITEDRRLIDKKELAEDEQRTLFNLRAKINKTEKRKK